MVYCGYFKNCELINGGKFKILSEVIKSSYCTNSNHKKCVRKCQLDNGSLSQKLLMPEGKIYGEEIGLKVY